MAREPFRTQFFVAGKVVAGKLGAGTSGNPPFWGPYVMIFNKHKKKISQKKSGKFADIRF